MAENYWSNVSHVYVVPFGLNNESPTKTNFFIIIRCAALGAALVNTVVFLTLRKFVFKYLLVMSISDALYEILLIATTATNFYANDPNVTSQAVYTSQQMRIYLSDYLTTCMAVFNVVIECLLTTHRIILLTRSRPKSEKTRASSSLQLVRHPFSVSSIIFGLLLLVYSPVMFIYQSKKDKQGYIYSKTEFGQSRLGVIVLNTLNVSRIVLTLVILSILNTIAILKFKRYFRRKKELSGKDAESVSAIMNSSSEKARLKKQEDCRQKNITLMLIVVSFFYIIGNIPYSVHYILRYTFNIRVELLLFASVTLSNLVIILKTPVYYMLDSSFRNRISSLCLR